jgi:hypothetical protein
VVALIAFLAIEKHPYGFYIFTRWAVFLTCCYGLYFNGEKGWKSSSPFFAIVGLIFNPILPIYLHKEMWHLLDFGTAVGFLISIAFDPKDDSQKI